MANNIPAFAETIIDKISVNNGLNPKVVRQLIVNGTIDIKSTDPATYSSLLDNISQDLFNRASNGEKIGGYQPSTILSSNYKRDLLWSNILGFDIPENSNNRHLDFDGVKNEVKGYPILIVFWIISAIFAYKAIINISKSKMSGKDLLGDINFKSLDNNLKEFLK